MIEVTRDNQEANYMTIVPIPLENSSSVVEFFKQGGEVEIPRPEQCLYAGCGLKQPLRKNGTYARQVIYWGLCFLVEILRFRCRRCGKTASCPYGWLVPYHRFSAEVIAAGIEAYGQAEMKYRDLNLDLSDMELANPEMDIRSEELCKMMVEEPQDWREVRYRPAHTTVFYWVDFACKRIEGLLMQIQKELIQEMKRGKEFRKMPAESVVENPNSYKAASDEKRMILDRLSFAICAARSLLGQSKQPWVKLRAYFLTMAESRKDLLTDTRVSCQLHRLLN
jgi:hypothetical protein